jgi:hypothetical protein
MTTIPAHILDEIKSASDLAQLIGETVPLTKGWGCCPFHGEKSPSFHVKPDRGLYHCFGCGAGGDIFDFYGKINGLTFPQTVRRLATRYGVRLPDQRQEQPAAQTSVTVPAVKSAPGFTPVAATAPLSAWQEHAAKLVDYAHDQLLQTPEQMAYLAARGLDAVAVATYRLGWLAKDHYRVRSAWGLPAEISDKTGQPKKLWLPQGVVIPAYAADGTLHRVRIRCAVPQANAPRYYWVPGSGNDILTLRRLRTIGPEPVALVESDLDALLLHHLAGDIFTILSLGTCSARPRIETDALLKAASVILVALDSDKAGAENWPWWRTTYHRAERWPCLKGKDPGEAWQQGEDLRAWLLAGLPVTTGKDEGRRMKDEKSNGEKEVNSATSLHPSSLTRTISAKDGRSIVITSDPETYRDLQAAGKIVFTDKELALVVKCAPPANAARLVLDCKEVFAKTGAFFTVGTAASPGQSS